MFSFLPNWNPLPSNFWQRIPHTVVSQQASNKPVVLLHAFCMPLPCSIVPPDLEHSVEQVLTANPSAHLADY